MSNPSIVVRIAFADNSVNQTTPTWTDISTDLISLSIYRGRQHELNRIEAGTARITLLNTSGNYWPSKVTGDYYPNIKPLKRINIRAIYGGTTYDLYTGFIESWQPDFIMQPIKGPVAIISAVDLQKNLSNVLWTSNEGQAYSGTRIYSALSYFGWPTADRNLDTGISLMQAQNLSEANVMAHLYKVQDSENGIMFIQGNGYVAFHDRYHRLTATKSKTSQAVFGDDVPPGGTDKGYTSIYTGFDDLFIYNDIHFTRIGGTVQIATDSTSITTNGRRTYAQTNLLNTSDGQCLDAANYIKSRYKDPAERVRSINVNAGADQTNLYPLVFGLDISDRISIRLQQASVLADYYIEAVNHTWNAAKPGEWITAYQLSSVSNQAYWSLGDTGFSELGETTVLCY